MNKKIDFIIPCSNKCFSINNCRGSGLKADESDLGGLKEWNTDMPLEADFILDKEAQKLADEAAKASMRSNWRR